MRSEVARSVAVCLAVAGCLSAPPSGGDESPAGGDAGTGDGTRPVVLADAGSPVTGCTEGSELDLAYVSRVALAGDGDNTQMALADLAVFINPGPDLFEADDLEVSVGNRAGIAAAASITARDGHLALPAGEAHGALSLDNGSVVLPEVDEEWTDNAFPALDVGFTIVAPLADETDVVFEITVDHFHFEAPVTLVPEGSLFAGDPLDADRISARCGE